MTYKGNSVSECIKSGNKYWCGTELKSNNEYKKWGWCKDDCPNPDKSSATTTSAPGLFIKPLMIYIHQENKINWQDINNGKTNLSLCIPHSVL